MRSTVRAVAVIFVSISISWSIFAQSFSPSKPDFSILRSEVQQKVAAGVVPGLAIAVVKDGQILWQEGFGWADIEKRTRATEYTPFYVASVTKSITASAIMKLQEQGKIQLDDPVNDYLGAAKVHSAMWNSADATVRRVLSHTGGLTTFTRWCLPGDPRCKDMDAEIKQYGVLVWPPGEVFDYSNLGYGILGNVVERTSKQNLGLFLRDELFGPLDMRNCGFDVDSPNTAAQYDEKSHKRSPIKITGHPGASGLRCSAHDLLRFGMLHLKDHVGTHPILSDADIDEMHRSQASTHGQHGLGWEISEQSGYQVLLAQGGTSDAYAIVKLIPSQDLAIVVIANSYAQFVSDLGDKIISTVIPNFAVPVQPSANPAPNPATHEPPALAGSWTGQIVVNDRPVSFSIEVSPDGSVVGQIGSAPRAKMTNVSLRPRHLYGQLVGMHLADDSEKRQHMIEVDLGLRGDDLMGAVTSGSLPGEDGDQLPHWAMLSRKQRK